MTNTFLTESEARDLAGEYFHSDIPFPTQEILDSGAIPRLKGYKIKPGKVSDSIFGGYDNHFDKNTKEVIEFENPTLETKNGTPLRLMVRRNHISTHDIVRGDIPLKDQILAMNHNFMRRLAIPYIGTSQFDIPGLGDNSIVIAAENLTQIPFENVIRGYIAKTTTETSLYVNYMKGERTFCGHKLPDDLIPNGKLPYVIDTPSTKSDEHDESLSPKELFERKLCTEEQYTEIRNSSLVSFGVASNFFDSRGIIFVDTKKEHGINRRRKIVSQDEIYTMDSSRFWLKEDYENQLRMLKSGEINEISPKSFSKEFARGLSKGEEGYTPEQSIEISTRYILGIQHLLGKRFEPDMHPSANRIIGGLQRIVEELVA